MGHLFSDIKDKSAAGYIIISLKLMIAGLLTGIVLALPRALMLAWEDSQVLALIAGLAAALIVPGWMVYHLYGWE